MSCHTFAATALIACMLGAPMTAQEVRFGVQGGLAFPTGDLTDTASTGVQIGAHALWAFGRGHGLMARVEIQAGPFRLVSLMSSEAADELGLEPGVLAVAAVASTSVVVETTRRPR